MTRRKKDNNMYNHLQELLKKLHIEQNEPHRKSGCSTCATSGKRLCMLQYHAHYIPKQDSLCLRKENLNCIHDCIIKKLNIDMQLLNILYRKPKRLSRKENTEIMATFGTQHTR